MKSVFLRRNRLYLLILFGLLMSLAWGVGASAQATIDVTTTDDSVANDGVCSLREAIMAANQDTASGNQAGECEAGSGADTIELQAGAYVLTRNGSDGYGDDDDDCDDDDDDDECIPLGYRGDLDIAGDLTIVGIGRVAIQADPTFTDRLLQVHSGNVQIENITLEGANTSSNGAGVFNAGSLTIIGSTISGNSSSGTGGGVRNSGTLTVANSTISGNTAAGDGGGFYNRTGTANFNNITIANNVADSDSSNGGNGGGIRRYRGRVYIGNSIIAGNFDLSASTIQPDCSGRIDSLGYNIIQDSEGCSIRGTSAGNQIGVDPLLGSLADNGGFTYTHELLPGSLAIDTGSSSPDGDPTACESTDQRGVQRPSGLQCDIGAFEADAPPTPTPTPLPTFTSTPSPTDTPTPTPTDTPTPTPTPPPPPALIRAFRIISGGTGTRVEGLVPDGPNSSFSLNVYASSVCQPPNADGSPLETIVVATDADGYFQVNLSTTEIDDGEFVVATGGQIGNESQESPCIVAGPGNDSWPFAQQLNVAGGSDSATQYLQMPGQSRWYKFKIEPDSRLTITLSQLPANYDLTIYSDIATAFNSFGIDEPDDLLQLGAEYAPNAFSPNAFSPDALSPNAFSPNAFSPNAFSPNAFSPNAFSPNAFSPNAFSPNAFSPDALSPDAFSPNAFSPNAFSPNAFSPNAFSPNAFSPNAFSSAQTRSLIGVSAFDGNASEGLNLNTWTSTGDFYIRVRGRNGAFSLASPFQLDVSAVTGECSAVSEPGVGTSTNAVADGFKTIVLVDRTRMTPDSTLDARLASLIARDEVKGTIVNVGSDARVIAANLQADTHFACPYAKNIVAESIREIVDRYRDDNPVEYVVIIGGDDVIPFFRNPDQALLGNESNYYPPVLNDSASQASLRLGYVLSQDAYGSNLDVRVKDHTLPIAQIPVGRLVEDASDMISVLDAYLSDSDGVVGAGSSLVTGYDFLEDAARAVEAQLSAGTGAASDTLIDDRDISPQDPTAWTADELATELFGNRHDLVFLAGHFSANSALAADYTTQLLTTDLVNSTTDFTNSIIFSAGCHAGYNIVNKHGIPAITFEPDWAQAFAQKGATLIAGTGYQYGDTDFIEYSERLYVEFSKQLRTGSGPVSIGEALVRSKQLYLAGTPQLRPIHEKAYLEATIFGLPMLRVDMPNKLTDGGASSIVSNTSGYTTNPGASLFLEYADVPLTFTLGGPIEVTVEDPDPLAEIPTFIAEYLTGANGLVQANPSEPVLPLEIRNVALPSDHPTNAVLRGVGFRGGSYSDSADVLPLTAAPATEIRGVHTPFIADAFYPVRPWGVNYFGALIENGGPIYLSITPAQMLSSAPGSQTVTVRQYSSMDFRLFYSEYTDVELDGSEPAHADAPTIAEVSSEIVGGAVEFAIRVNGNPAAGIQEVWVTYTGLSAPFYGSWQSKNLSQNENDSTLWEGSLDLQGTSSGDMRFIVQAVNGVGLASGATNQGAYYTPGVSGEPMETTSLAFTSAPAEGPYGTKPSFSAKLEDVDGPLGGKLVTFGLGPVVRQAFTDDETGVATVDLPLLGQPGAYKVRATYAGDDTFVASFADNDFSITKQATTMTLEPNPLHFPPGTATATLHDASGVPLSEKTVVFVLDLSGIPLFSQAVITDYAGRANTSMEGFSLAAGTYRLTAYFGGTIALPGHNPPENPNTVTLFDTRYSNSSASIDVVVNNPPECASVIADPDFLWSPNGKMKTVTLMGGSDPDGHAITIEISAVYQDEPLTKKFDAQVTIGSDTVKLRSERNGGGDGRVYHIFATVTDELGASCGSESPAEGPAIVRVPVNHDNSDIDSIDQGALYNSDP